MSQCPVCSQTITDDFGLIECENCGAQLIVHIDGSVEFSGEPPIQATAENPPPSEESEPFDLAGDSGLPPELDPEPPPDQDLQENYQEMPPEELSDLDSAPPPEPEMFAYPDDNVGEPEVYKPPGSEPSSPDLSDLAEFANSEDSGGREGPLRYNLTITGIDTSDIREAFREALLDRKFMWDIDQILRSIRHGEVHIEDVPPGKAYILVNRLRNLPVNVRWEQHAIHEP